MKKFLNIELIESDAEKLGGTPVFRGTRVPVQNLRFILMAETI